MTCSSRSSYYTSRPEVWEEDWISRSWDSGFVHIQVTQRLRLRLRANFPTFTQINIYPYDVLLQTPKIIFEVLHHRRVFLSTMASRRRITYHIFRIPIHKYLPGHLSLLSSVPAWSWLVVMLWALLQNNNMGGLIPTSLHDPLFRFLINSTEI